LEGGNLCPVQLQKKPVFTPLIVETHPGASIINGIPLGMLAVATERERERDPEQVRVGEDFVSDPVFTPVFLLPSFVRHTSCSADKGTFHLALASFVSAQLTKGVGLCLLRSGFTRRRVAP